MISKLIRFTIIIMLNTFVLKRYIFTNHSNKPLGFDGDDRYYWKDKMKYFMESRNIHMWDFVQEDPYTPIMKTFE